MDIYDATSDINELAMAAASCFDGCPGTRIHQVLILAEARARGYGSTVLGDGAVVARTDGHVTIPALEPSVRYNWKLTVRTRERLDDLAALHIPVVADTSSATSLSVAELVDEIATSYDLYGESCDEMLDDRIRDHPALVGPIRAARAAKRPVALPHEILDALGTPAALAASEFNALINATSEAG